VSFPDDGDNKKIFLTWDGLIYNDCLELWAKKWIAGDECGYIFFQ